MLRKHLAEIALETDQLDLAYIYIDKAFQYYKSESGRPTTASLEAMLIAARIAIRRAQLFQLEERDNSPAAESWYGEAANILDNVVAYANRITPTPTHLQARAIALKSQIILGSFSDFGSSVMRMLSDGSPQAKEANALAQEALALSNQNGDSREFLIAQESAYEALRISNLYLNNEVQAKEYAEKALVAVKKIYGKFHPAVAVAHMRLSELDSAHDLIPWPDEPATSGSLVVGGIEYGIKPSPKSNSADLINFDSLIYSSQEALDVSGIIESDFLGQQHDYLIADAATEAAVRAKAPGKHILHFATHGFSSSVSVDNFSGLGNQRRLLRDERIGYYDPLLPFGIALSNANLGARDNIGDGILTGSEIALMDLRGTELVVVSGCDTAVGSYYVGEGMLGLMKAFRLAGATAWYRLYFAFLMKPVHFL